MCQFRLRLAVGNRAYTSEVRTGGLISCSGEDLSLGLTRGSKDAGTRRNCNNK
ncbi:MAG: hypothetical protein RMY29_027485 [Nostoc sp. CreGUA01]|nr:hypothetical protein [Nostoc sp. CreGUA01]